MEASVVEGEKCACGGAGSLEVLGEVHRAYERRMALLDEHPGADRLQLQLETFRSWVSDLVGQNTLLARAVAALEADAAAALLNERRRHAEARMEARAEVVALRGRLARARADVRGLLEVLRRLREFDCCTLQGIHFFDVTESDIFGTLDWRQKALGNGDAKHRKGQDLDTPHDYNNFELKVRTLIKEMQQYEQTIVRLRSEMPPNDHCNSTESKKDAEVMAGTCCTGNECGDWEPVRETSTVHEDVAKYQERIKKMEANLKASGAHVRALRTANVSLGEEAAALRGVCGALHGEARAAAQRAAFAEDVLREMRRQLHRAKAKLKEVSGLRSASTETEGGGRVDAWLTELDRPPGGGGGGEGDLS